MLKDRKGSLIGESDVITLYCQPFQRICDLFLSFNTNQKPRIKSPKSGNFENKFYIGRSPDPLSSRPNIKEEKAVWLRETNCFPDSSCNFCGFVHNFSPGLSCSCHGFVLHCQHGSSLDLLDNPSSFCQLSSDCLLCSTTRILHAFTLVLSSRIHTC